MGRFLWRFDDVWTPKSESSLPSTLSAAVRKEEERKSRAQSASVDSANSFKHRPRRYDATDLLAAALARADSPTEPIDPLKQAQLFPYVGPPLSLWHFSDCADGRTAEYRPG